MPLRTLFLCQPCMASSAHLQRETLSRNRAPSNQPKPTLRRRRVQADWQLVSTCRTQLPISFVAVLQPGGGLLVTVQADASTVNPDAVVKPAATTAVANVVDGAGAINDATGLKQHAQSVSDTSFSRDRTIRRSEPECCFTAGAKPGTGPEWLRKPYHRRR